MKKELSDELREEAEEFFSQQLPNGLKSHESLESHALKKDMSSLPGGQLDPMIESRIIKLETEMEALMKANVIEDVEKLKHELDENDSTNK